MADTAASPHHVPTVVATLPADMRMVSPPQPPHLRGKGLLTAPAAASLPTPTPASGGAGAVQVQDQDSDKVLVVKRVFDSIKKLKTSFKSEEAFVEFVQQAYKRKRGEDGGAKLDEEEAALKKTLDAIDAEIEVTKDKLTKLVCIDMDAATI